MNPADIDQNDTLICLKLKLLKDCMHIFFPLLVNHLSCQNIFLALADTFILTDL